MLARQTRHDPLSPAVRSGRRCFRGLGALRRFVGVGWVGLVGFVDFGGLVALPNPPCRHVRRPGDVGVPDLPDHMGRVRLHFRAVRAVCTRRGYLYQGFSLLTANRDVVGDAKVAAIAARHGRTPAQVILRFALDLGMIALTGTRDPRHMREDLAIFDLALSADEGATIEALSGR